MIDDEITFREKGYRSTDLKPNSHKEVWAVCEGEDCQRDGGRGRWVSFRSCSKLCADCARKNRRYIQKVKVITEKLSWVDDDITFDEMGYRSTWLKPNSNKPVWAVCANPDCEREGGRGRWVIFKQCRELCWECSMKKIRKHDYGDSKDVVRSIDEEKTYCEKGYISTSLSAQSHKPVWAICIECGEGRWLGFCDYSDVCYVCAMKKSRKYDYDDLEGVVKSIDEDKTYAEKGYRSSDLSAQSSMKVYSICVECGEGRWVSYQSYHDMCHKCAITGENNSGWKGGISLDSYCKFFNEPLKIAIRNYFNNICFECGGTIKDNNNKNMSVHHISYDKECGCNNAHFCVYVPLCNSCHSISNYNRWYWYTHFMTELAVRNPNYYAYHIPVVFYDEPSYNYSYVFEKNRKNNKKGNGNR